MKRQRDDALIAFSVRVIPPKDKQGDRFNRELQNASRNLAAMDANKRRAVARSGVVLDFDCRTPDSIL
ncbi:hypothetical protein ACLBR5_18485 [Escherichia coli]